MSYASASNSAPARAPWRRKRSIVAVSSTYTALTNSIRFARFGAECDALDLPFFLEPVSYYPAGTDPTGLEFAKLKPGMVVQTMEEFSKPVYRVDVLKVEFPVTAAYVEGSETYRGQSAYSMQEALDWFRAADAVAQRPYIYLSAGVTSANFTASLRMAAESALAFPACCAAGPIGNWAWRSMRAASLTRFRSGWRIVVKATCKQ